jgi:hypothetical protein
MVMVFCSLPPLLDVPPEEPHPARARTVATPSGTRAAKRLRNIFGVILRAFARNLRVG